jgi:hypothetical protein
MCLQHSNYIFRFGYFFFNTGFLLPLKTVHCMTVPFPGSCLPALTPFSILKGQSPLHTLPSSEAEKREKELNFPAFPPPCFWVSSIQNPCNLFWQGLAGEKYSSFPALNAKRHNRLPVTPFSAEHGFSYIYI